MSSKTYSALSPAISECGLHIIDMISTTTHLQVSKVDGHEVHGNCHVGIGCKVKLGHLGIARGEVGQYDSVGTCLQK